MSFGDTPRGPELVAALIEVTTDIRRLQAKALEIVAEMDREQIGKAAGYSSLPAFLRDTLRVSQRTASRTVARAQQISETLTPTGHTTPAPLPSMREASLAAAIEREHPAVVAEVLKNLPASASTPGTAW